MEASPGQNRCPETGPDEFLAYTQDDAVKVAVLDVWMPATSGIEVQGRLHESSPEMQSVPPINRQSVSKNALLGGAAR